MRSDEPSVFHLHPLRRCNLSCLHCYSDSSPQAADALPLPAAMEAVGAAAGWGYGTLAVAGGEPLLYAGLPQLLAHARACGMQASVVTNGLLLRSAADLAKLRDAHAVTVSIDGLAEQHDRMRGRAGAHAAAADAVRRLADAGVAAGVACGVTAANLDDLEEVAANAACWGARVVTFHLVEPAGRAAALPPSTFLTMEQRVRLYAMVALLAAIETEVLDIRVDLHHRRTVLQHPELLYATSCAPDRSLPARAVPVLVLDADGTLVPACHGFHRGFAVGRAGEEGASMWERFFDEGYTALRTLGTQAFEALRRDESVRVLNPDDWLAERSHAVQLRLARRDPLISS